MENSDTPTAPFASETSESEAKAAVELFELCTALLLGLGATLGSISSYEGGLWSGVSIEKFGESARKTTEAADEGTFADSKIASDTQIKIHAIQLLARARTLPAGDERDLILNQVGELYIRELSTEAYESLDLPPEAREKYDEDNTLIAISDEDLLDAGDLDFGKSYYQKMYAEKKKLAGEAATLFEAGRKAGGNGDEFALVGVYFTLSLFFAGLGLVFKTRVRWAFFTLGTVVLIGASIFMARLEWT